jgi:hypothetical protein
MTQLFLIHSLEDAACARQLRHDLAQCGYVIWAAPSGAPTGREDVWQTGLRDSRSVLVIWSAAAAQSATVAQQLDQAQWLHKNLVVVATDPTALPAALAQAPLVRSAAPCADATPQILARLPPAENTATQPQDTAPTAGQIFAWRCRQGHVTYFDRRVVCRPDGSVTRSVVDRDGKKLDALLLRCGTAGCAESGVIEVDCEGYR